MKFVCRVDSLDCIHSASTVLYGHPNWNGPYPRQLNQASEFENLRTFEPPRGVGYKRGRPGGDHHSLIDRTAGAERCRRHRSAHVGGCQGCATPRYNLQYSSWSD